MRLFDTHAHIQAPEFDGDREDALQRARDAGLVAMLVLGWDVSSTERARAFAEGKDGVLVAAGCHPHSADEMDDASLARLASYAEHENVVAVGEIGLDFYRNFSEHGRQIEVFRSQLEVAAAIGKPAAIHCREAHDACLPILTEWSQRLGGAFEGGLPLGVMHYFSGDAGLGRRYADLGLMISIHTSVTYPKSEQLRAVARELPLETLVVETDSPYGAPQSLRGRRNEPANVIEAVRVIAEVRGEPLERVAEATTGNALRLFSPATVAAQRRD